MKLDNYAKRVLTHVLSVIALQFVQYVILTLIEPLKPLNVYANKDIMTIQVVLNVTIIVPPV
jgi:hypothetical protein